MDKDEPEVPEELRDAIAEASRYLGIEEDSRVEPAAAEPKPAATDDTPSPGTTTPVLRYEPSARRWVRPLVLGVILVATLAGSTWLSLRSRTPVPARQEEVDLRWAVARVVRRVETMRNERGRLPEAKDLYGLLGRAVTYLPSGDRYRVVGDWGGVHVEYDGTVPLDTWVGLSTSGGGGR